MREHAHQMLDRLPPSQLAAVVHVLEALLDEGGDTLSPGGHDGNMMDHREMRNRNDAAILERRAESLNAEAEDVLGYAFEKG